MLVKVLAPLAPFMAEEMWSRLGYEVRSAKYDENIQYQSVHLEVWPKVDIDLVNKKPALIVVQVNGKVRSTLAATQRPATMPQEDIEML
jgi:leucyl-tRNA synthetase